MLSPVSVRRGGRSWTDCSVSNLCTSCVHPKKNCSNCGDDVAAFCICCGAEITLKAEACPACGTPRHGMSQPDLDVDMDRSQVDAGIDRRLSTPLLRKRL
jgi:hypothetical protein